MMLIGLSLELLTFAAVFLVLFAFGISSRNRPRRFPVE
jgi:hypothetical protein